jgi:hypothetical protein
MILKPQSRKWPVESSRVCETKMRKKSQSGQTLVEMALI